ncbi:MAG TPA: lysophospholipid acyltransferase family protein [Mycobacteriales bacterium]|nr:lysophospholipid acyltransferase family protein [Mycobacteriales bacterium]HWA65696.1 lysophospholipid acyltransferase family protein [Mycobacteriales bacterium]
MTRPRQREWVYRPVIRVALTLFRLLGFRFTIEGVEQIPASGGAVLACNHVSYFDFMFVGLPAHYRARRLVRFMAKKSVFDNPVSGPLMRGMHHIPVDRAAGAAAYRSAVEALKAGELVGVFPESTISRAFVPREIKSGAARMAIEAGVPLIPVVVWGGHRVWTTGRKPKLQRGVPVVIEVAAPMQIAADATVADLTVALHAELTALVEKVQASYPAPVSADEQWWQPAHLGGGAPTLEEAKPIEAAAVEARAAKQAAKRAKRS